MPPVAFLIALGLVAAYAAYTSSKKKDEGQGQGSASVQAQMNIPGLPAVAATASTTGPTAGPTSGAGSTAGRRTGNVPYERTEVVSIPASLQSQILATVSKVVDSDNKILPTVTEEDIQALTALAGQLEYQGFPDAARSLRELAQRAGAYVAPAQPKVTLPGLSPELQAKVNRALQVERDPLKLQLIANQLKALPNASHPSVQSAIETLESMIVQLRAQQSQSVALQEIDQALKPDPKPATVTPPVVVHEPEPAAPRPRPAAQAQTPAPAPAPALPANTPIMMAAKSMIENMWTVQRSKGMPGAKGKEDAAAVKRFQGLVGDKDDGKAGPGTLFKAAEQGRQYNLPLVFYWPRGATKTDVLGYRAKLQGLADKIEATENDSQGASQLRESARRERGQGGIAGAMPS